MRNYVALLMPLAAVITLAATLTAQNAPAAGHAPGVVGPGRQSVSPADINSISEQMKQVRAAASALLDKAGNSGSVTERAAAVEKAAEVLKLAAEVDRQRTELAQETAKLQYENENSLRREHSEQIRDYVAFLTPLVTIITLAATLVAQNWQFLRSEKSRREAALDTQWQDAVRTISASGGLSPAVVVLQPFLRSPKYSDPAKDAAVDLLSHSSDVAFFTSLFGPAFVSVDRSDVDRVVRLDRQLVARGNPIWNKTWDPVNQTSRLEGLTDTELATYNYIEAVTPAITAQIRSVLRMPSQGKPIDLSGTYFVDGDWSGINFSGVNLENVNLNRMNLQNAELEGLTQFSGSYFWATAWWQAKSINRPLLEYLTANSPFQPRTAYAPRNEEVPQVEYDQAVQRLSSQLT